MSRLSTSIYRPLAVVATAALLLAGCADPRSSGSSPSDGSSQVSGASSDGKTSMITKSWGLEPVASVENFVPAEFKGKAIQNGIYNDFPPQMFLEGTTLVGIQPDLALAIGEVMGVQIANISVGSFDSLIPGTVSGRYQMSSADFGVTADRLKQVDFVTEFPLGTGFGVKTGSSIKITKASDLCGHSVGVLAGSYFIGQVKALSEQCVSGGSDKIGVQTYPNDGARTLALTNGRIEVMSTTVDALGYQIKSQNVPIELQSFQYEPVEQAIVIPDGSALGAAVQAAMKEIISNGTYLKILKKWGVEDIAYHSADQVLYLTDPSQAS